MRISRGCLFSACCSKGVSLHHLHLAETQRQGREWRSICGSYKKKSFKYVLIWSCWHGEAEGRLTRSMASCVLIWEVCLAFPGWSCVGSENKNRKSGWHFLQRLLFGSWAGCYRTCESWVLLSYMIGYCPFVYSVTHWAFLSLEKRLASAWEARHPDPQHSGRFGCFHNHFMPRSFSFMLL